MRQFPAFFAVAILAVGGAPVALGQGVAAKVVRSSGPPPLPPRAPPVVTAARQEPVRDGESTDATSASVLGGRVTAPTLLANGEKRFGRTDLEVPGRGQVHFRWTRTYRSRLSYDGPLGFGWDFVYNEGLYPQPNGDVLRSDGAGHVDRWTRLPGGSYSAPPGFFGTLIRRGDGTYVLREVDGFQRHYAAHGRVFQHRDRCGNTMDFAYDGAGRLVEIRDAYQRTYTLAYQSVAGKDRITSLTDFSGRQVGFTYSSAGDLAAVRTPLITGTPTGNDFPFGRTESYTYTAGQADAELNHNLATITRPNEAGAGPAAWQIVYGSSGLERDRVVSETLGGVNVTGQGAGGTATYSYSSVNAGQPLGQPGLPRLEVLVIDRGGNPQRRHIDELDHEVLCQHLTIGLRPAEPASYDTASEFDADGQLARRVFPEGNALQLTYPAGPRAAQRFPDSLAWIPDAARGGGNPRTWTFAREPLYQFLLTVTDPRGNDSTYVPPLGTQSAARYTTRYFYDYQESSAPVPDAIEFGINLAAVARGLGDQNADGRVDQWSGNLVRIESPLVLLDPASQLAQQQGSTVQAPIAELQWNDHGQLLLSIDPEGAAHTCAYHPEEDPDGDGVPVPGVASADPSGYLSVRVVDDAVGSYRRTFASPPRHLDQEYRSDPLGRVTAVRNPRGVETRYSYNACDELVQITRGADVSVAVSRGQLLTGETAFNYKLRFYYDANSNVVLTERENRASVSVTPGVGTWVERSNQRDILDNVIEITLELDATRDLVYALEYDPNELRSRRVYPRGNDDCFEYDERNLPFRLIQAPGTPDEAVFQIDYDGNGNPVGWHDAADSDGIAGVEVTTAAYDGFDSPILIRNPVGTEISWVLDPAYQVVQQQVSGHPPGNPAGAPVLLQQRQFVTDELKRVTRMDESVFLASGFTPIDPQPFPLAGDGVQSTYLEYNARDELVFRGDDDGHFVAHRYDGAGQVCEQVDPAGNSRQITYDGSNNVVRVADTEVNLEGLYPTETFVHLNVFNQLDLPVRSTENTGASFFYGWDSMDQLTGFANARGPLLSVDPAGLFPEPGQSGRVNDLGNLTVLVRDGGGRVTVRYQPLTTTGVGGGPLDLTNPNNPDGLLTVQLGWDDNGSLVKLTDDLGRITRWQYNLRDEPVGQTLADGGQYVWNRNADGGLVDWSDPNGNLVTLQVDAANRPFVIQVTPGPGVAGTIEELIDLDGLNRVTGWHANVGTAGVPVWISQAWIIDSRQLVLEEQFDDGVPRHVSNVFHGDGTRESVRLANGLTFQYEYDVLNRPECIYDVTVGTELVAEFDYLGRGVQKLPNGQIETIPFDRPGVGGRDPFDNGIRVDRMFPVASAPAPSGGRAKSAWDVVAASTELLPAPFFHNPLDQELVSLDTLSQLNTIGGEIVSHGFYTRGAFQVDEAFRGQALFPMSNQTSLLRQGARDLKNSAKASVAFGVGGGLITGIGDTLDALDEGKGTGRALLRGAVGMGVDLLVDKAYAPLSVADDLLLQGTFSASVKQTFLVGETLVDMAAGNSRAADQYKRHMTQNAPPFLSWVHEIGGRAADACPKLDAQPFGESAYQVGRGILSGLFGYEPKGESAGAGLEAAQREARQREAQRRLGNGATVDNTYDSGRRVETTLHTEPSGATLMDREYRYTRNHQNTREIRNDPVEPGEDVYTPDSGDRTKSMTHGDSGALQRADQVDLVLDGVGNRVKVTETDAGSPTVWTYTVNVMNQYTTARGLAFAFDDNGNLIDNSNEAYFHDYRNRMIRVEIPGVGVTSLHTYFPDGRKARSAPTNPFTGAPWEDHRYTWNGEEMVSIDDVLNAIDRVHGFGPGGAKDPITRDTGTRREYIHRDGRGNTAALTFGSSADQTTFGTWVTWRILYEGFGCPRTVQNLLLGPYPVLLHDDLVWDQALGRYVAGDRIYSPYEGRYQELAAHQDARGAWYDLLHQSAMNR